MSPKFGDNYDIRYLFKTIRIKEVMRAPVPTISESENISEVEKTFIRYGVTHLCVVDAEGRFTGLISQKYLYKMRSPQKILPGQKVEYDQDTIIDGDTYYERETLDGFILTEVMDKNTSTLSPEDPIAKAVSYIARLNVSCVPILTSNHKVCGMISEKDILKLTADLLAE